MKVTLLTTPGCAVCEKVKGILNNLGVEYDIIDVTEQPEMLEKYPFMAAPGIVIDGKLEFSGDVSEKELKEKLQIQ